MIVYVTLGFVYNSQPICSPKRKYMNKFLFMVLIISEISFSRTQITTILLRTTVELFTLQVGAFQPYFDNVLDSRELYITGTRSYSGSWDFWNLVHTVPWCSTMAQLCAIVGLKTFLSYLELTKSCKRSAKRGRPGWPHERVSRARVRGWLTDLNKKR